MGKLIDDIKNIFKSTEDKILEHLDDLKKYEIKMDDFVEVKKEKNDISIFIKGEDFISKLKEMGLVSEIKTPSSCKCTNCKCGK